MKKKAVLSLLSFILVASFAGRIAWIEVTSVSFEESARSPDGKNVVRIASRWSDRFFGGVPSETHEVRIESKEGLLIRRIFTEEPWTGWPKDSIITWASDSASVVVKYKVAEARQTQLVLKAIR